MGGTPLAYTVHHKGRTYPAGMSSDEIGAIASEFGDHVWEGGRRPDALPKDVNPAAGTLSGEPPVPIPSGMPSPEGAQTLAGAAGAPAPPSMATTPAAPAEEPAAEPGGEAGGDAAKKTTAKKTSPPR